MEENYQGFTVIEALLIILIVAVVGFGGYYVWHSQKINTLSTSPLTNHKSASNKTTPIASTKPSPYAGWNSETLTNEKLTFSYPSNWQFTNSFPGAGSGVGDMVSVKAPSGVELNITTENMEHPSYDGPRTLIYSDPTTFLGKQAYVDYYADGTSNTAPINGGTVAYSSTDYPASGSGNPLSSPDYLKTINMSPQGWLLIQVTPATNSTIYKSDITSNIDFKDINLIVQSMHY